MLLCHFEHYRFPLIRFFFFLFFCITAYITKRMKVDEMSSFFIFRLFYMLRFYGYVTWNRSALLYGKLNEVVFYVIQRCKHYALLILCKVRVYTQKSYMFLGWSKFITSLYHKRNTGITPRKAHLHSRHNKHRKWECQNINSRTAPSTYNLCTV